MSDWLQRIWYRPAPPPLLLKALAALYGAVAVRVAQRRAAQARRLPVPVIVVGNITVGGTGKTPCVLWLVEVLRGLGHRPGVLSRGYGGSGPFPLEVAAAADPAACGDEPALLAMRSGVPVVVAPDRHAAGTLLLSRHPDVDVLVCDDGLQHYGLARDLELCVVDGRRGLGNGWLLPAGPLREAAARAASVDLVLVNGGDARPYGEHAVRFDLHARDAMSLDGTRCRALAEFAGTAVHAVAGIGDPARFFDTLRGVGIHVIEHPFADHHAFAAAELQFDDDRPVLMTEKDAVKCRRFARAHWWSVAVDVSVDAQAQDRIRRTLHARLGDGATQLVSEFQTL